MQLPSSAVVSVPVSSAVPRSSTDCGLSSSARQTTKTARDDVDVGVGGYDDADAVTVVVVVASCDAAGVQHCWATVAAFGTDFSHHPDRMNPRWSSPSRTSLSRWCADRRAADQ